MSENDNFPRSEPLLLELSDAIDMQTTSPQWHRTFRLAVIAVSAAVITMSSLIVIGGIKGSDSAQVAPAHTSVSRSTPVRRDNRFTSERVSAHDEADQQIETSSGRTRDDGKPGSAELLRHTSEPHVLAPQVPAMTPASQSRAQTAYAAEAIASTAGTTSGQRNDPQRQKASGIEPYRNGTLATHLGGEALRLALIEDRRLTREMNKATLRDILADQKGD
jgi:hypothetical protein